MFRSRVHAFLVALAASLGMVPAHAGSNSGFDVGVRLGYGLPFGPVSVVPRAAFPEVRDDYDMNNDFTGSLSPWVDLGYRFLPNLLAGVFFSDALVFVSNEKCPSPANCSAHDLRLGIQSQYRIRPHERLDPWIGIGTGLEYLGQSGTLHDFLDPYDSWTTFAGVEFFNLQGGLDLLATDRFAFGPFGTFSLAKFNSMSLTCNVAAVQAAGRPCPPGGDIHEKAFHEWLVLGLRAVYDP